MSHTRKIAGLVAGIGCLALAAPASAHHGCAGHARGGKISHKTKEAHVFTKNNHWYGCASRVGRPRLLPGLDTVTSIEFGDGTVPTHITLSGVFVAYERYTLYPAGGAGDTQTDLYVVDLRTGKPIITEQAASTREGGVSSWINRIVLKRNGSVGWLSQHHTNEVHRFSNAPDARGRTMLDSGDDIDREFLTLSSDRLSMSWTKGGATKSAPLP